MAGRIQVSIVLFAIIINAIFAFGETFIQIEIKVKILWSKMSKRCFKTKETVAVSQNPEIQ
jgi:hypothetical protein